MPKYQSIKDHDVCTERTSNLAKGVYGLILFLMGIAVAVGIMEGMAATQYRREIASMQYEYQLDKCKGGQFCRVETDSKTYRFLTISGRDK